MRAKKSKFENKELSILESRSQNIYNTPGDMRGSFFRDYCRILHSTAYRRLKHKTQVFFNVGNDHICTRMEHVNHVESVSHSIAIGLGLDCELTSAIAIGHDLGHAPFGHHGETVLDDLMKEYMSTTYQEKYFGKIPVKLFWHEKNGLRFVDMIELLPDRSGIRRNLNLTYAVRDGIISHCGEIDESNLKPRADAFDLNNFNTPGEFSPYTWEGCAVKLADKIAYLGRDIEDALTLNYLSDEGKIELQTLARNFTGTETLNTTGIMHSLISDICINSTPESGLTMSTEKLCLLNEVKKYNYKYIYDSPIFNVFKDYAKLILTNIFMILYKCYDHKHTISCIKEKYNSIYPQLTNYFTDWLNTYCVHNMIHMEKKDNYLSKLDNEKIYGSLDNRDIYVQAIIDFISGMTDAFAIDLFNELITFE
jgi:dGTPase